MENMKNMPVSARLNFLEKAGGKEALDMKMKARSKIDTGIVSAQ